MTNWDDSGPANTRIDLYRRAFDLSASAALLIVMLPVMLMVAIGSAIALRTWPFFTQYRVGRDGKLFRFLKVRTLAVDIPAYIDKHQLDHASIPAFCRLLRRLHLDELPQLFLVLPGHMSLVGPRPEMAHLHDRLAPDFAALRTSVRPGCTGLWQVSEACTDLIGAAPEYDCTYLARRTLRMDLWVLAHTALKMVGLGRGVTLEDIPRWVGQPDRAIEVIARSAMGDTEVIACRESAGAEQHELALATGR